MAEPSDISDFPFDGAATWAKLTPEVQAELGAYALEAAVAHGIACHSEGPAARAATQAEGAALFWLRTVALGDRGIPERGWIDVVDGGERFRLPTILGAFCQACGSSEDDPCKDDCGCCTETTCDGEADRG